MERQTEASHQSVDPVRSRNMAAIRRANTKPELALRSALHREGLRFRKDYRINAAGVGVRPDIAFTRARLAVFVDGCFWHSCPEHSVRPKTNPEFWAAKLARNVERDQRQNEALNKEGWRVIRVWEHEPVEQSVQVVLAELRSS